MVNRLIKKTALILVAALAMTSIVTGCSSSESGISASAINSGASALSSGETDDGEPYELDVYFQNYGTTMDDEEDVEAALNEILMEKINATVNLHPIDSGAWSSKISLMFSSGDKIDVIQSAAGQTPSYASGVSQGMYAGLNDLLDEYGTDIVNCLGSDYLEGTAVNGTIYGIPINKSKGNSVGFLFNKELVDKYNLDVDSITSYKDLEPMLDTIAENEPGITPLCLSDYHADFYGLQSISENLGTNFGGVLPKDTTDYQLVDLWDYEPYVEALEWTQEMYDKGYVNKSALTDTDFGPMQAGKAFCLPMLLSPDTAKGYSESWGVDVIQVSVYDGFMPAARAQAIMTSIGSTSENPEKAMQFVNLLYSDANVLNTLVYGVEDEHYVVKDTVTTDAGNTVTVIAYPDGIDSSTVSWANQNWLFGDRFLDYIFESQDPNTWDELKAWNESLTKSKVLGFVFDQTNVATEISSCSTANDEFWTALNIGAVDPTETLAKLKAKLEAAGYNKIKEEKQSQLDTWVSQNIK